MAPTATKKWRAQAWTNDSLYRGGLDFSLKKKKKNFVQIIYLCQWVDRIVYLYYYLRGFQAVWTINKTPKF